MATRLCTLFRGGSRFGAGPARSSSFVKISAGLALAFALALALPACRSDTPASAPQAPQSTAKGPAAPYRLSDSVVPRSDSLENFGIDLNKVASKDAELVRAAWADFQRIVAGGMPECLMEFGLSDGGSMMYDCGAYKIMRVKCIAGLGAEYGYDYGPSLDFLNGHKVERLKFHTVAQLRVLEGKSR